METLSTHQFIHQFMLQHQGDNEHSPIVDWIYNHPTIVKIGEVAGMILGLGSIVCFPLLLPALGMAAIPLAGVGGFIALVSFVAYQALDILIPPHHAMSQHAFQPAVYGVGKLYYKGDIPILEIQSDDPYEAGKAHGYLMAEPLDRLLNQLNWVKKFMNLPQADEVPKTVAEVRKELPERYIEELQGIVDGYNQWSEEYKWFGKRILTVDDLILFHLMPDSLHFVPKAVEFRLNRQGAQNSPPFVEKDQQTPVLGCTVVIDQDDEEGLVFGRNMDWPSFGLFGTYTLLINRKYKDQNLSTVEVGFPGFAGTLTGMNKAGLSLSMNVCGGRTLTIQGIPAAFFNRLCLESCRDLEEVEDLIEQNAPLGSYHLSVATAQSAKSFHLYQGKDKAHVIREWEAGNPLITTNCQYPSEQNESSHMHCSRERKHIIQDLFQQAQEEIAADEIEQAKLVQASLSLPYVNNIITTHTVVMYPQSRKIQLAWDNAFAGQADLQELDVESLLD